MWKPCLLSLGLVTVIAAASAQNPAKPSNTVPLASVELTNAHTQIAKLKAENAELRSRLAEKLGDYANVSLRPQGGDC